MAAPRLQGRQLPSRGRVWGGEPLRTLRSARALSLRAQPQSILPQQPLGLNIDHLLIHKEISTLESDSNLTAAYRDSD